MLVVGMVEETVVAQALVVAVVVLPIFDATTFRSQTRLCRQVLQR
jgi:hypothetical protein